MLDAAVETPDIATLKNQVASLKQELEAEQQRKSALFNAFEQYKNQGLDSLVGQMIDAKLDELRDDLEEKIEVEISDARYDYETIAEEKAESAVESFRDYSLSDEVTEIVDDALKEYNNSNDLEDTINVRISDALGGTVQATITMEV